MIGWHHPLNRCVFEQALGDGEGQGSLASCSPWGRKESDMPEWLNNNSSKGPRTSQFQAVQVPVVSMRVQPQVGHASPQGSWSQAVIPSIALWCPGSWEHMSSDWWLAHSLGEMRCLGLRLQRLLAFCLWLLLTCLSASEESLHLLCCSSLSICSLIL